MITILGKLAKLWEEWRTVPDGSPRRRALEREINDIEKWMISSGIKTDGSITRFHTNANNPSYPDATGCIWHNDLAAAGIPDDEPIDAILLSSSFDGADVVAKLYSPKYQKLILVKDNPDYRRRIYVRPEAGEMLKSNPAFEVEDCVMNDIMTQQRREMCRVSGMGKDLDDLQCTKWNNDMKQLHSYFYTSLFRAGAWFSIQPSGSLLQHIGRNFCMPLKTMDEQIDFWKALLDQDIPDIRRIAFDIEVGATGRNVLPDPMKAEQPVTAIAFHGKHVRRVNMLNRWDADEKPELDDCEVVLYDSEREMLEDSFAMISNYPMVVTYNGDTFDMPYLYNRAVKLGIEYIPFRMMSRNATLDMGIHLDMYGVFSNRALKIYAFNATYTRNGLGDVAGAMLGHSKEDIGDLPIDSLPPKKLAKYCHMDARLTYDLTTFDNSIVMNTLMVLTRLSCLPIDEVSRRTISTWIKGMIHSKHILEQELIPNSSELPRVDASTAAIAKDKKYRGATVFDPRPGVYFDVTVLDFASLYPSIIKENNISYETVRCPHDSCRSNTLGGTPHWVCMERNGTLSLLIGSLKDIRVNHYKSMYRETGDSKYGTIAAALKVFLNASYGTIGSDSFPLFFLPTAEVVTAIGRETITKTAEYAESIGVSVLYGDTDSIFVQGISDSDVARIADYAKSNFSIDLEVDKKYRMLMLSGLKKNYFGVRPDGSMDIKGLSGKKSNTPRFIRDAFDRTVRILGDITDESGIERARHDLYFMLQDMHRDLSHSKVHAGDLAYNVCISQEPSEYKIKPQVIKAAEQLGTPPEKGQFVSFVKTLKEPRVKPVETCTPGDIDIDLYQTMLENTIRQITDMVDLDYDGVRMRPKQTTIDTW